MFTKQNIFKILTALSLLGILLASYLFYNFLTKPAIESCFINSIVNCDAVTKGSLSTLFGIPVALIGFLGYVVILISTILKKQKLILGMSIFGMIFCLYLTIQEIFILKVICSVCLTCQIVMFLVFLLAIKLNYGFGNKIDKSHKT